MLPSRMGFSCAGLIVANARSLLSRLPSGGAFLATLRVLILCLRPLLPELCGFGSGKLNSKVPPTAHVCGFT